MNRCYSNKIILNHFQSKISADLWRDGGFKPFYTKVYDNVCDEGMSGVIIKKYFNVGKNCVLKRVSSLYTPL